MDFCAKKCEDTFVVTGYGNLMIVLPRRVTCICANLLVAQSVSRVSIHGLLLQQVSQFDLCYGKEEDTQDSKNNVTMLLFHPGDDVTHSITVLT
jgi:hypothetical protein